MLLQFSQTTASGVQGRRAQEVAWAPRRTPVSTTLSHSPCGSATCLKILSKSWSCIGPVHKRVLTTSSKIRSFEDPGCFFKNAMMISRTRSSKASCPTTVAAGNTRARGDLQRFSTRSRLLTFRPCIDCTSAFRIDARRASHRLRIETCVFNRLLQSAPTAFRPIVVANGHPSVWFQDPMTFRKRPAHSLRPRFQGQTACPIDDDFMTMPIRGQAQPRFPKKIQFPVLHHAPIRRIGENIVDARIGYRAQIRAGLRRQTTSPRNPKTLQLLARHHERRIPSRTVSKTLRCLVMGAEMTRDKPLPLEMLCFSADRNMALVSTLEDPGHRPPPPTTLPRPINFDG